MALVSISCLRILMGHRTGHPVPGQRIRQGSGCYLWLAPSDAESKHRSAVYYLDINPAIRFQRAQGYYMSKPGQE